MSSWGRFFDGPAGAGGSASMSASLSPISCPTRQHACVVEARSLDRHRLVGWSSLGKTRTMDLPAAMSASSVVVVVVVLMFVVLMFVIFVVVPV